MWITSQFNLRTIPATLEEFLRVAHNIPNNKSAEEQSLSHTQSGGEKVHHVKDENDEEAVKINANWEPPHHKPSITLRSLSTRNQALVGQLQEPCDH